MSITARAVSSARGRAAIKVILVTGVLAFLLLYLASLALQRSLTPDEGQRVIPAVNASPFDGQRAMGVLREVAAFGPRPAGSEGLARTRALLESRLRGTGLGVRLLPPAGSGSRGPAGLAAHRPGPRPGQLVLATRYNTRPHEDPAFTGANSEASGTAWLLEAARVVPADWVQCGLWFAWLNLPHDDTAAEPGPEAVAAIARLLETVEAASDNRGPVAVVYVAAVGDCYLGIPQDPDAPPALRRAVWETARRLGYDAHFLAATAPAPGPPRWLRAAGLPSLAVVDPVYGGSVLRHEQYWQTAQDTVDKTCAASLQAVGDVIYHALPAVGGYLDQVQGRP